MIELKVWRTNMPMDGLPGGRDQAFVVGQGSVNSIIVTNHLVLIDIAGEILVMSSSSGAGQMSKGTYDKFIENEKRQYPATNSGAGKAKPRRTTPSAGKPAKTKNAGGQSASKGAES